MLKAARPRQPLDTIRPLLPWALWEGHLGRPILDRLDWVLGGRLAQRERSQLTGADLSREVLEAMAAWGCREADGIAPDTLESLAQMALWVHLDRSGETWTLSAFPSSTRPGAPLHFLYSHELEELAFWRIARRTQAEKDEGARTLMAALKSAKPELLALREELLGRRSCAWEDKFYRFYHQSFKVFRLQAATLRIVEALEELMPGFELNAWFLRIVREGTGREFRDGDNRVWLSRTRPILEAFSHAGFFLEMAIRHADLAELPESLPSGWAALLYLYDLR
jgi:hypothetical protein